VMVSTGQPTSSVRSAVEGEAQRLVLWSNLAPQLIGATIGLPTHSGDPRLRPPVAPPPIALTVVSTVVLRC
jgi:hypothetical protein